MPKKTVNKSVKKCTTAKPAAAAGAPSEVERDASRAESGFEPLGEFSKIKAQTHCGKCCTFSTETDQLSCKVTSGLMTKPKHCGHWWKSFRIPYFTAKKI